MIADLISYTYYSLVENIQTLSLSFCPKSITYKMSGKSLRADRGMDPPFGNNLLPIMCNACWYCKDTRLGTRGLFWGNPQTP